MEIPKNHELIEGDRIESINVPYDLIPGVNESCTTDLFILSSWVKHMNRKNVPYCVTRCGKKLVLFVEKTGTDKTISRHEGTVGWTWNRNGKSK